MYFYYTINMTKYVALIRAISPTDSRKTNDKLRGALETLRFSKVETVISSGNVIFESDEKDLQKLEAMIEEAWPALLGFQATTIVRSRQQLQNILKAAPYDGLTHGVGAYLLVTFSKGPIKPSFTSPYQPQNKPFKILGYTRDVLFSATDNTSAKTGDLMTWLEKQFGTEITSRTPLTIERIIKRMAIKT